MGIRGLKMNLHEQAPDTVSVALHTLSLGTIAGVIMDVLPVLAVLLPVIYYSFLIWETKTMVAWRKKRRKRRHDVKAARLKAKLRELDIDDD